MNTRRISYALGAAGGGMLAAAFLSTAVAFADTVDAVAAPVTDVFGFAPSGAETVVAVSGLPPLDQQVEGYQDFLLYNTPTGATTPVEEGFLRTDVSAFTTSGFTNTEYLVTSGVPNEIGGTPTDPVLGTLPPDGSVYDIATFLGLTNEYSDVVGGTVAAPTDTITDTLVTPFGSIDLSPLFDSFATSVNPADLFATTVNPDIISGLESLLGAFALPL